jgi:mono/diheme cytochrome c family protein
MNETLFFLLGISLVVAAVLVAGIGLRWERFPTSKAALTGATAAFAALVVATAAFSWMNAEDEQEHRETELAESAEANAAAGDEGEAAEEVGSQVEQQPSETATVDGAAVFEASGCAGCHTLAAADATGTTGPDLDEALAGKDEAFIETSIVDPAAEVASGFTAGIMPETYGDELSPEELSALVQFLSESTSG